jgi:homoserine O-acetyltransferase
MADHAIFEAGDVMLQSGVVLPDVKLVYRTHGQLNAARDNAILYPTHYLGTHDSNAWAIAPGMALDPEKYFIIIPNMLGNGVSSSPSNTPAPFDGPRFPLVTVRDNVLLQHRLVTELFGLTTLALVTGHSMGALQTFQWGALFPDMVRRVAPFCGAARVSRHNWLFLEGCKSALQADAAFAGGDYAAPPVTGIRAFARVYAGWAWSKTFSNTPGSPFSRHVTQTICWRCSPPGRPPTSAPIHALTVTSQRRWQPSRPRQSSCRVAAICISRQKIAKSKLGTCRTPSCASSRRSGGIWPAAG